MLLRQARIHQRSIEMSENTSSSTFPILHTADTYGAKGFRRIGRCAPVAVNQSGPFEALQRNLDVRAGNNRYRFII
jgi:hypothetical protein